MRRLRNDSPSTVFEQSMNRDALLQAAKPIRRRPLSALCLVGLAAATVLLPGCHEEFDTSRSLPQRASVGEEMFGVICDRVGAQALREDLTGDSFRNVCHRVQGGQFSDTVDTSKLPATDPNAHDEKGAPVSVEQQDRNRAWAVGRVQALAKRRAELIRAFDKTFPETKVPIKDLDNPSEQRSCDPPAGEKEGTLTGQVADMLGRMTELYHDGTLPQSTQSLARLVDSFRKSPEAQASWARLSSRQGYRPIETALGVARPVVAYPQLRDLSNTTLRLLSADSQPYQLNPIWVDGSRVPVPGAGNETFNKLLEAAHIELTNTTADPRPTLLTITRDTQMSRPVLSRPRDNLEILQELFYKTDDAFGGGAPHYIVRRDARGYAALSKAVVGSFVDEDKDGLPDVDDMGRYKTAGGSLAPSPFPYSGTVDTTQRDQAGRAVVDGKLVYEYLDTNKTFASHLLDDLKPLFNPDPNAQHETIMDLAGGLYVGLGEHVKAEKTFANGKIAYDGITPDAPLLDLLYAGGIILGDRNADATLAMAQELVANQQPKFARLVASLINAQEMAKKHDEAKIPKETTFWDDVLEITGRLAARPELLKDIVSSLADPASAKLGNVLAADVGMRDDVTYDQSDLNGPTVNLTTKTKAGLVTPVDRKAPITGFNRSALQRVLQQLSDTRGVTICNKADAILHAKKDLLGAERNIELPRLKLGPITLKPNEPLYKECGVIKIDDLALLYVDSMGDAIHTRPADPTDKIPPGTLYLRDTKLRNGDLLADLGDDADGFLVDLLRGFGKPTTKLMAQSSGISGFWMPDDSDKLAPTPHWLSRFAHFDFVNDTTNAQTKKMIEGLMGPGLPTAMCPVEMVKDPTCKPDPADNTKEICAIDASDDHMIPVRRCQDGQWFEQRNPRTLFVLEQNGFLEAIQPLIKAFIKHKGEDIFLDFALAAHKYYGNKDASAAECMLQDGKQCTRSGLNSYEALMSEQLVTDIIPALSELVKTLGTLSFPKCDAALDANGLCPAGSTKTVTGIDVVVDATRALADPTYAKDVLKLKDRKGNVGAKKNDGSPVAQVTPAYLLTGALNAVDAAFDAYEAQHPDDTARRANYRRARSQLVDLFMATTKDKDGVTSFTNPTVPKLAPSIIEILRAQLNVRCPKSFAAPYDRCTWASEELAKKASETLTGPLASTGLEILEIIRRDPEARVEAEHLMQYLLDPGSNNDARASVLASAADLVQLLRDEENLVPLYHVMAAAVDASKKDAQGRVVEKSLIDAQMSLLAKLSGRYYDESNHEICKREVDPNQVLTKALANLVTPISDGDFNGQSPLEVIIDVVADVNRVDPTQQYAGTLTKDDYVSVSDNVVDFLINKERGLEQFYEVIRQGTRF